VFKLWQLGSRALRQAQGTKNFGRELRIGELGIGVASQKQASPKIKKFPELIRRFSNLGSNVHVIKKLRNYKSLG